MQTIITKSLPVTATKGDRVKAIHSGGATSVTLSWNYSKTAEENHGAAAQELLNKLDWKGSMIGGQLEPNKYGWVFEETHNNSVIRIESNSKPADPAGDIWIESALMKLGQVLERNTEKFFNAIIKH